MRDRVSNVVGAVRLLVGGRCRQPGGIVLGYHDVVDGPPNTAYDVSPQRLRSHVQALRAWGLQIVPLTELVSRLTGGESVDGLVAFSFDDALEGVHRHALPILTELDVPFTVFVVSAELGTDPPWWPGAGRIMTRAHLAEVAAGGAAVECHTRHHASLPGLAPAALVDEVQGAKHELEDIVGAPTNLLAYPFGHHDPPARAATIEAGFVAGFSFVNGRVTPDLDAHKLPRFTMDARHARPRLALHVARPPQVWPDTQADRITGE